MVVTALRVQHQYPPETNELYGSSFPEITVEDWVHAQKILTDHLGIDSWEMVAGGRFGRYAGFTMGQFLTQIKLKKQQS